MKDFTAADGVTENEFVINRSRFIATAAYVENYDEAAAFVKSVREKYKTATHNCYAYISNGDGTEMRFSDDGEPQGTAGQPMLEVLNKRGLRCTAVVVTRYFGGVKLGAGGLVSAYTRAVSEVLDKAPLVDWKYSVIFRLTFGYDGYKLLLQALKNRINKVLNTDFGNTVVCEVAVPCVESETFEANIKDVFCGKCDVVNVKNTFVKYDKI